MYVGAVGICLQQQADFQTALENVNKSVGEDQLERFVKWEEEFGSK